MKIGSVYPKSGSSILFTLALSAIVILTFSSVGLTQNPARDTLATGQILTVSITSPADGDTILADGFECEIPVEGFVTLGGGDSISVLYIVDVSGSTESIDRPPVTNVGDENNDGLTGTILDAEIAAIISLNESLGDPSNVEVGIIAFANGAVIADVDPLPNSQEFTTPPDADRNNNGIPDIEEVARSLDTQAGPPFRAGVEAFTDQLSDNFAVATDYNAALELTNQIFSSRPNRTTLAFFLSDGRPFPDTLRTDPGSPLDLASESNTQINTFGIALAGADTAGIQALQTIADSTRGRFENVQDPTTLSSMLQIVQPVGISDVTVNGNSVLPLSPIGAFSDTLRGVPPGPVTIEATAITDPDDQGVQTSVTATVDVQCISGDTLNCKGVEIVSPEPGAVICTDSSDVTAVATVVGGQPPIQSDCIFRVSSLLNPLIEVPGTLTDIVDDTLFFFTARVPIDVGLNTVEVVCTFTDANDSTVTCNIKKPFNRPPLPTCVVEITSPESGSVICDTVKVAAVLDITSGVPPFTVNCDVNGEPTGVTDFVTREGQIDFMATLRNISPGDTTLIATCTIVDSCGNEVVCADTISVTRPEPPVCTVQITSPDSITVSCVDTVSIEGELNIAGGLGPFDVAHQVSVNGEVEVESFIDGTEDRAIPFGPFLVLPEVLELGQNNIIAVTCTVTDSCGFETVCTDTVVVFVPEPPVCTVQITSPDSGSINCDSTIEVTTVTTIEEGLAPFTVVCEVNGVPSDPDTIVTQDRSLDFGFVVDLTRGQNDTLVAKCTIIDSCGSVTMCTDTVVVFIPDPPVCAVEITSPDSGSINCDDTVEVTAVTTIQDGLGPFKVACEVNGIATDPDTVVTQDRSLDFAVTIPLTRGQNDTIVAKCTIIDSCGFETTCFDTVVVFVPEPPVCAVEITSPEDGSINCDETVEVTAVTTIEEGLGPFKVACEVNGIATDPDTVVTQDRSLDFAITVPLTRGQNDTIVAKCTIVDSCGFVTMCTDTVIVFVPEQPECTVEITVPNDGDFVCDTVKVVATTTIEGGLPPFNVTCDINGEVTSANQTVISDTTLEFMATLRNISSDTTIVATCTIVDSCGATTVCVDSIRVRFDDGPPICTFNIEGLSIVGVALDEGTGIASIVADSLFNVELTIDDFEPGAEEVGFRLDVIDVNKPLFFNIIITDLCGNTFECDPVFVNLSADADVREFDFSFPDIDRYLQVTNYGLREIQVDLNGSKFTLISDLNRAEQEPNSYYLPDEGKITIDLIDHLNKGENNMVVVYDGLPGTSAEFFLLDTVAKVDYRLELEVLPETFQMAQNYPNPFNPTTKIQFDLPAILVGGAEVQLRVYNLLGEMIQVLVDEHKLPGKYTVEWDGKNKHGQSVASGVYIYQLVAGEFKATKRMLLLK